MGGQVRLVHVTVLGDWLAACLAARFASVAVPARGVGVALGSGGPTLFVFLGWGACARDWAEGGCVAVWLVACGLRPLGAPGRVIGRVSGCVSVGGCVSGRGRGLAPGGVGAGECGRAFVCVRAGRGARVIGRGMVYAYLAGRGPTKTRCGWLCVPGWSHPVFGDSLCGF